MPVIWGVMNIKVKLVMAGPNSNKCNEYVRVRVLVSGRVQGVGFRNFAARYGNALKLTGRVKNLHDGSVEVIAEGKRKEISEYIDLLKKGPIWARIDNMLIDWQQYKGDFTFFGVQ
jgi:acylphosphatase